MYVNNEYKGTATYGDNREDVYNVYPKYTNHNSGFHFDTILPNVTQSFNIKIVIRNKVGIETNYEKTVNLKKLNPMGYLDSPVEGANITYFGATGSDNNLYISGWYLDVTPIKSITVYVDNVQKYTGTGSRLTRNDVYNAYPQYNDKISGFQVTVPKPPSGGSRNYGKTISHVIKVVIVNNLGEQMEWTRTIKVFYENPTDPGTWT